MEVLILLNEFSDLDLECLVERETFDEWVRGGLAIDYDGHGRFATKDGISDIVIKPSGWWRYYNKFPIFTHVCWYNR